MIAGAVLGRNGKPPECRRSAHHFHRHFHLQTHNPNFMARLWIQLGDGESMPLDLRPGQNRIGRNSNNDFQIDHPSVSPSHCELVLSDNGHSLLVRDLGSDTGTFVNQEPVTEMRLQDGQVLKIGEVELTVEAPLAPAMSHFGHAQNRPDESIDPVSAGSHSLPISFCWNHPQTSADYECIRCPGSFCSECAPERGRAGNVALRFCPACGAVCQPAGTRSQVAPPVKTFFQHIPEAFQYPFRGDGWALLLGAAVFFAILDAAARFISALGLYLFFIFAILTTLIALGYLVACIQKVVTSSAQGEETLPSWPDVSNGFDDILVPFLQFLGVLAFCFAPALLVSTLTDGSLQRLVIPLFLLGIFYFPMAILAVLTLDTVGALHPKLILTSIFRIPLVYLSTCILLFILLAAGFFISEVVGGIPIPILPLFISHFIFLYFLVVQMRVLGIMYYSNRHRLGWF
jgi:hypothetical protein